MIGSIVNVLAIITGSLLGYFMRNGIKEEYKATIIDGLALSVLIMGIMSTMKTENFLLVITSVVIGSIVGEIIGIEKKLDRIGFKLQQRFGKGDSNFSKGFITATLVFCIGAMSIVGSIEAGLTGNYKTLFAKSVIDGVTSIIFASSLGIGVIFSIFPVFIYQGTITILSTILRDVFTPTIINEMSAVGGVLIAGIAINLMGIKKIRVSNMLPALIVPIIYILVKGFVGF
ncbi:DUF554 domain-containing protein [Tissierella creatinophila]|uniref:Putative membrane protein YdfK n=1 Tax=Tissierella creatinophila DSM 6911 TaxID=1123403 RepID=A0A1U7M864_TISCR|nr:DUF554 domain-containing protein [Tissierella creatinophila]OLS03476.1 putative membrane protein YdfK [Tissierella creatinophila DSM 6911]